MYDTDTMIALSTLDLNRRATRTGGVITQEMVDEVIEVSATLLGSQEFPVEADFDAVRRELYRRNNIAA